MAKSFKEINFNHICAFPQEYGIPHLMARELESYFKYKNKPSDEDLEWKLTILSEKYKLNKDDLITLRSVLF